MSFASDIYANVVYAKVMPVGLIICVMKVDIGQRGVFAFDCMSEC